jgi:hypothetical protein
VWPVRPEGSVRIDRDWATLLFEEHGTVRVVIPQVAAVNRAAFVWRRGRLERLF